MSSSTSNASLETNEERQVAIKSRQILQPPTKGLIPALSELLGGGESSSVAQDVQKRQKGLVPALSELLNGVATDVEGVVQGVTERQVDVNVGDAADVTVGGDCDDGGSEGGLVNVNLLNCAKLLG